MFSGNLLLRRYLPLCEKLKRFQFKVEKLLSQALSNPAIVEKLRISLQDQKSPAYRILTDTETRSALIDGLTRHASGSAYRTVLVKRGNSGNSTGEEETESSRGTLSLTSLVIAAMYFLFLSHSAGQLQRTLSRRLSWGCWCFLSPLFWILLEQFLALRFSLVSYYRCFSLPWSLCFQSCG